MTNGRSRELGEPPILTPERLEVLLNYQFWTKREALCILAGIDPDADKTHDEAVTLLARIRGPERHVEDGIRAGRLDPDRGPAATAFLEALPVEKREEIRRAVQAYAIYEEWSIRPAELVRYALENPRLFPESPLEPEHLVLVAQPEHTSREARASGAGPGSVVTERKRLSAYRYRLIDDYLRQNRIASRALFCKQRPFLGEMKPATLGAIVRGEHWKYSEAKKQALLEVLAVSEQEWNTPK